MFSQDINDSYFSNIISKNVEQLPFDDLFTIFLPQGSENPQIMCGKYFTPHPLAPGCVL